MSIAHPSQILQRGTVHPAIRRVAIAIQDGTRTVSGGEWRVTSIWRPSGTHSKGISLDASPMVFTMGGFGLKTALSVWKVVKQICPQHKWLVNAELDHVHIQLFHRDTLAMNTKEGTVLYPLSAGV